MLIRGSDLVPKKIYEVICSYDMFLFPDLGTTNTNGFFTKGDLFMVLEQPVIKGKVTLDFGDEFNPEVETSYVKCISANNAEIMGFLFFNPDDNWFCEVEME